jgi:hypothetical protein
MRSYVGRVHANQDPRMYFVRTIEEREESARKLRAFLEDLNEVMGWPSRDDLARRRSMRPENV